MKYVLIIGDGMADEPIPALGGRTPLECAETPALDRLAQRGEVGSVCNCPPEFPAGSDTAILSILGNDPRRCYTGRSPLEAASFGVQLAPGDITYRCNLITLEGDGPLAQQRLVSFSAGSVAGGEAMTLARELFVHPDFAPLARAAGVELLPSPSFRQLVVQRGAALDGLCLLPPHEHEGARLGPLLPSGCENAGQLLQLMEQAQPILARHPVNSARRQAGKPPVNGIWFWAPGTVTALPSFWETYRKRGAVISAVPLAHGIARLSGLEAVEVAGATGLLQTNYAGKVAAALAALDRGCDFAAVHLEAPDECSHNGDLPGKLQAIRWLDSRIVAPLVAGLEARGEAFRLLAVSDHRTLVATGRHDSAPVPFLFYDSRVDTSAGLPYNEENGARGRFFPEGCAALMPLLFGEAVNHAGGVHP